MDSLILISVTALRRLGKILCLQASGNKLGNGFDCLHVVNGVAIAWGVNDVDAVSFAIFNEVSLLNPFVWDMVGCGLVCLTLGLSSSSSFLYFPLID